MFSCKPLPACINCLLNISRSNSCKVSFKCLLIGGINVENIKEPVRYLTINCIYYIFGKTIPLINLGII